MSDIDTSSVEPKITIPDNAAACRNGFSPMQLLKNTWWLPASYCIPYLFCYLIVAVAKTEDTLARANKAGLLGLLCAALIWALWYLDCRFGARQWLKNSRDPQAKAIVYIFGIVLWLTWLSVGIIIGMTNDQVFELSPQLPGLSNPY